jgi:hypothetical protein
MGDDYRYPSVDPDLRVCADCFGDDGLKDFVRGHADATQCSFCGATASDDIAAPLGEVIDHMLSCLARDYNDPDNAGMVYESAEGGYQGTVWDTYDFVQDKLALELPNDDDNSLFDAICNGLGSQLWCTRHLYSLGPDEALAYSWETFCKLVKHESRFFFTQTPRKTDDRELLPPNNLLELIAEYAVAVGLVRTMPAGQIYFRARYQQPGETLRHPRELGPPTPEFAKQNRMSPAGIVMTYVSEDAATALDETADEPGMYAIGQFRALRDITILDLAQLPPIPSLFAEISDTLPYDPHEALRFLHRLADDISRPIARDDRVHIEYVPTQVVTEFLRTAKLPEGVKLDGIRYRSSRRDGAISLVLFADRRNVAGASDDTWPKPDPWLELVGRSERVVAQARSPDCSCEGLGPR